jgi:hypothetical protein
MARRRRRRQSSNLPTLGEINRAIDELFHPHFHKGPIPIVADTLAHAAVEQDPQKSVEKFLEYNFGPLVREVLKITRAGDRKRSRRTKKKS